MRSMRGFFVFMVMFVLTGGPAGMSEGANLALAGGSCVAPATPFAPVTTAVDTTPPAVDLASEIPADPIQTLRVQERVVSIASCWTNDPEAFQQVATTAYMQRATGAIDPQEQISKFRRVSPIWVTPVGAVTIDALGRYGVTMLMQQGQNTQFARPAIRWYLVDDGGVLRLDQMMGATIPEGELADARIVEVDLLDGEILVDQTELPALTTLIFRVRNSAASGEDHMFYLGHVMDGYGLADVLAMDEPLIDSRYFDWLLPADSSWNDLVLSGSRPATLVLLCQEFDESEQREHFLDGEAVELTIQ